MYFLFLTATHEGVECYSSTECSCSLGWCISTGQLESSRRLPFGNTPIRFIQGGGALLTYTNGSSVAEATKVESKGGGWIPAPSHDLTQSVPSLQIASWRKGFFKSLMTLSSTTLLLGEEQRKGMEGGSQAIRTASGDLEIAPAAGEARLTAVRNMAVIWCFPE